MEKNGKTTESRRKFLKTAGKFAVYTPPALMMMSQANAADSICKSANSWCVKKET
ncbi:MAG: hypothetical protein ACRBDX_10800 [Gammaproteobacteria bacterium]